MASISDIEIKVDVRASLDTYELGAAIALCGLIEGTAPASLPALSIPAGWELAFDSPVIGGFDNKWQLWKSPGGRYMIVIRGTTKAPASLIEDLLCVMIPARGAINVAIGNLPYAFAEDPLASVHFGFAVGALLLLLDRDNGILATLDRLMPAGSELIVAGHSQGAAIATLVAAFFVRSPSTGFKFAPIDALRGYFVAQPKPGNDHFARDLERIPALYRITNSLDFIPQLPLTLQGLRTLNDPNPLSIMPGSIVWNFIAGALDSLRAHLIGIALAKFNSELAKITPDTIYPAAGATIIPGTPPGIFDEGLNFEPAGLPITLAGNPGVNPINPADCAWQHHAAQYAALLNGTAR